jgi:hypothetical protein
MTRRVDVLALAAAAMAFVMTGVYVAVVRAQDDGSPAPWVVAVLVLAGLAAGYAARRESPGRLVVLSGAALLLGGLGLLALLSVGLPLLLAAALCLVSVLRSVTAAHQPNAG